MKITNFIFKQPRGQSARVTVERVVLKRRKLIKPIDIGLKQLNIWVRGQISVGS